VEKRFLDLDSNGGSWKVAHLRNAPPEAMRERQGPRACAMRRLAERGAIIHLEIFRKDEHGEGVFAVRFR